MSTSMAPSSTALPSNLWVSVQSILEQTAQTRPTRAHLFDELQNQYRIRFANHLLDAVLEMDHSENQQLCCAKTRALPTDPQALTLTEILGGGAHGTVLRAKVANGSTYAVKVCYIPPTTM